MLACESLLTAYDGMLVQQVGAPAAALPPRTNVLEMGRYLAQNGISVEQVRGLPHVSHLSRETCAAPACLHHTQGPQPGLLKTTLWDCMYDMCFPKHVLCQPSRGTC